MKIFFVVEIIILLSHKKDLVVRIKFLNGRMFDYRELKLMFLDPTDLIINIINRYLNRNKTIKFIFS